MSTLLHVITHLSAGGAERQLSYLASELARRGHSVHVAYLYSGNDPAIEPNLTDAGVVLHQLDFAHNYDPRLLFQLHRLIRRLNPDVIQSWILHSDVIAGLIATFPMRKTSRPWIIREPNWPEVQPTFKMRLRCALARRATAVIANSNTGLSFWKERYPLKKTGVIRNGFPVEKIIQGCAAPAHAIDRDFVLFVGRLHAQKNVENTIDAIAYLPDGIVLLICGTGPLFDSLRNRVRVRGLQDRVLFMGVLSPSDIWCQMKQALALVLVSHYEGFPNVLVEGMLNLCPLVVSDIAPHREFLHEDTACFVDQTNPRSIADGILNAVHKGKENAVRAFPVARRLTVEAMTDQYETIYSAAAHQHRNR